MSKAEFSKIGNIQPTKKIIIPLKVYDYVFTYQNKDLNHAKLEYYFDSVMHVEYIDGKRNGETYKNLIDFSISAEDEFFNTFTFCFALEIELEQLKSLPMNTPININEYILPGEVSFYNPYKEKWYPFHLYLEEDGYHEITNFFVTKIEENKFVFKVQASEIGVFFWFHVELKK